MGQTRSDTSEQRQAKRDGAKRRQCPKCLRKNALSAPTQIDPGWRVRECRYCGHGVGIIDGKPIGY